MVGTMAWEKDHLAILDALPSSWMKRHKVFLQRSGSDDTQGPWDGSPGRGEHSALIPRRHTMPDGYFHQLLVTMDDTTAFILLIKP